ncbi:MAG: ATP-binding cassette domain-containing protein, partial [bacterium]|nr:ATP-binding cassette domain-containing protein [bacterium]
MTERDVLLRAHGITKAFEEERGAAKTVLDGLDLEIHRRSLVVIRGESGCGKSTLLRLLGLVDPDFEGSLEVCGTRVTGNGQALSAAETEDLRSRHIGFVFQDDLLLPLLNLQENSELPARIHRLPKPRISERLGRLQELMFRPEEIAEGVMRRRRTNVSGGQRQRAAILRALSHGPDLILADEPTASLDPQRKSKVIDLFKQLCRAGATILVASHDSIFRDVGETYELAEGKLTRVHAETERSEETPDDGARPESFCAPEENGHRARRLRGCPPGLQVKIAFREALGNLLFAFMIVAAMAAGLFQLTLLWSVQAGTQLVLDDVINKGSRLDRVEVAAKAQPDETTNGGLPSVEVLAELAN